MIQVHLVPDYHRTNMSGHPTAASRHQPARMCKKENGRSSGSVQRLYPTYFEEDIDRQNHESQAVSTHLLHKHGISKR
jgi:hypothetical protein